jgi:hypothetical protein
MDRFEQWTGPALNGYMIDGRIGGLIGLDDTLVFLGRIGIMLLVYSCHRT